MNLLILVLATWRLSALFSYECGPWDIFKRFRERIGLDHYSDSEDCESVDMAGNGCLAKLFSCVWCLSIYIAIIVFVLYQVWPGETILILSPFALSAGVIIVERVTRG